MKSQNLLVALDFLLLTAASGFAQEGQEMESAPALEVAEGVITSQVSEHAPVDSLNQVSVDQSPVYCWTRIVGAEGGATVEHVWYRADEEMARVQLNVGGPDWRTWSSKKIDPSWVGSWRVDVVGPDGTVLESIPFEVTEGTATPSDQPSRDGP